LMSEGLETRRAPRSSMGSVHMDSLTFNKFAAGILVALLLVVGIGKLGNVLYGPQEVAHEGVMEAGGEEMAADESGLAEPEEEGMSLAALLNVADLDAGFHDALVRDLLRPIEDIAELSDAHDEQKSNQNARGKLVESQGIHVYRPH
jgi:hypothetical protein